MKTGCPPAAAMDQARGQPTGSLEAPHTTREDSPVTTYTVGLDVHSKSSTFEIQDDTGRIVGTGEVPTTLDGLHTMKERFALPVGTKVGVETGTVSFLVARYLSALELEPVVVDAHEVRLKAH